MALGNKATPHAIAEKIKRLQAEELAQLAQILAAVSYTHLTLPTIYSV